MVVQAKNPHRGIKVVCIADPHLSAYNPTSYRVDYWNNCRSLLGQLQKFVVRAEVDAVVWAGDIFHLKNPARNPLWFISEVMEQLRDFRVPCLGILGNHDLKYGSMQGLKGQPAEILAASGLFHLLDREDVLIHAADFSLRIAGESFNHGLADGVKGKTKSENEHLMSVGHFWFGTVTGEFYGEPMFGPDYFADSQVDTFVIGHHHDDQGVVEVGGKRFVASGSMNITGAHKGDLDRRLAATLVTVKSISLVETNILRLKSLPIGELLDLEVREAAIKEEKELDSFVESLSSVDLKGADPETILAEMEIGDDVRTRAREYLEKAGAQGQK